MAPVSFSSPIRRRYTIRVAFFAVLCALVVTTALVSAQSVAAQGDDAYESELAKGNDLLRRRRWEDALKSFKKANDLRDKKSVEASFGMVQAYHGLEAYKNVVDTCEKIIELAAGEPKILAQVYNYEGIALQTQASVQTQAGVKDQKKLTDSEAVFRKGVALNTDLPILHYNLGVTLMELNRDAEGIVEIKKYISMNPEGSKAEEAARLIENPRRARETYAPDFSITTADGEYVTLEDLRGKVVLLDFWGTWCGPCVASVPALRELQKRFAKEPQFKMISVSHNDPEEKWREFIQKNQMVWTQYLDRDHHVTSTFEVHAYPTYILIDAEGIVRYRDISTRWERTGDLPEAIKKYLKAAVKSTPQ